MARTVIPKETWTDLPAPPSAGTNRAWCNVGSNDVYLAPTGTTVPDDGFLVPPKATVFFDADTQWVGKQTAAYSQLGTTVSNADF